MTPMSLLYSITNDTDQHESYLFGSIHLPWVSFQALVKPTRPLLDRCSSFAMEVLENEDAMSFQQDAIFLDNGRTLDGIVGDKKWKKWNSILEKNDGVELDNYASLKPFIVIYFIKRCQEFL